MGRELRRVPMDFNWPLNLVWKGFMNPYSPIECKKCEGSGLNGRTRTLDNEWYSHLRADGKEGWGHHLEQEDVQALVDGGRLMDFTHTWSGESGWRKKEPAYIPTAQEVNEWSRKGMGHDSINRWICVKARAKRLGFYGECDLCCGVGHYWCDDKYEKLWEDFQDIEPPQGEGYQISGNCV